MKKVILFSLICLSNLVYSQGGKIINIHKKGGFFGLYGNVDWTFDGVIDGGGNCGGGCVEEYTLSCSGLGTNLCKMGSINNPGGGIGNNDVLQEKLNLMMSEIDSKIVDGILRGTKAAQVFVTTNEGVTERFLIRANWKNSPDVEELNIKFNVEKLK